MKEGYPACCVSVLQCSCGSASDGLIWVLTTCDVSKLSIGCRTAVCDELDQNLWWKFWRANPVWEPTLCSPQYGEYCNWGNRARWKAGAPVMLLTSAFPLYCWTQCSLSVYLFVCLIVCVLVSSSLEEEGWYEIQGQSGVEEGVGRANEGMGIWGRPVGGSI